MNKRTLLLLTVMTVFVAALWWFSRSPGTLLGEENQQVKVVAVELRQRGPDKQTHRPVLVTVELADGARGKLWVSPPGPVPGQTLLVRVRRYDNGVRRLGSAR